MLSMLSWNIRQGGGSRTSDISRYLIQSQAQIIVLSEYQNNNNGAKLRHDLLTYGYRYQTVTAAESHHNSVAIFSTIAHSSRLFVEIDDAYSDNIVHADFGLFGIYGVYLPHKKKHRLFDFLLDQITDDQRPHIITGDFNSGINRVDQKGESFWYETEFKALLASGYIDAFRYIHKNIEEYSWYSHQGNGYRYDHTLVQEELAPLIQECSYLHIAREDQLSDHSPMVLTLA